MEIWEHVFLPLIGMVFGIIASTGFWTWIIKREDKNRVKDAATIARDEMILGLGHDRIMSLSEKYLALGEITSDEYENLHSYLYEPYARMGGNGGAKRNMEKVYKLEVKRSHKEERDMREADRVKHYHANTEVKGENEE